MNWHSPKVNLLDGEAVHIVTAGSSSKDLTYIMCRPTDSQPSLSIFRSVSKASRGVPGNGSNPYECSRIRCSRPGSFNLIGCLNALHSKPSRNSLASPNMGGSNVSTISEEVEFANPRLA